MVHCRNSADYHSHGIGSTCEVPEWNMLDTAGRRGDIGPLVVWQPWGEKMDVYLLVEKGPVEGEKFKVSESGKTLVGRARVCDVSIVDFKLSRIHCEIEASGGKYLLRDMGSRNGTFLNEKKAEGDMEIKDGDVVRIGDTHMRFSIMEPAPEILNPTSEAVTVADGEKQGTGQTVFVKTHRTCGKCGAIIPKKDFDTGKAREVNGKGMCAHCLDPFLGKVIHGYRLVENMGTGAMGSVYRAQEDETGREFAVKLLSSQLTANAEAVSRFLREAVAGGALDHPNIVKVYESGVDVDLNLYFLVMEFVDGESLKSAVEKKGAFNYRKSMTIGLQIGRALEAAFLHKIVHRDIKPANILLSKSGYAKLVDLGTSKSLETSGLGSLTKTGMGMGTIAFMPPEQIADAKHADHRSDIYSLGASLFYVLTGARPFAEKTPSQYFQAIREKPVEWPADKQIPDGVKAIIAKMMAKDPAQRPQTPEELTKTIEDLLTRVKD